MSCRLFSFLMSLGSMSYAVLRNGHVAMSNLGVYSIRGDPAQGFLQERVSHAGGGGVAP